MKREANQKLFIAFTETLQILEKYINNNFNLFEVQFSRYTVLTDFHSGGLRNIEQNGLRNNFINESSYYHLLCFLYKAYLHHNFDIKLNIKELHLALDHELLYTFSYPPDIEKQIDDAFTGIKFSKFSTSNISKFYEVGLDAKEKKRLGQFYTPSEIVRTMLNEIKVSKLLENNEIKLMDPACGAGIFLVEVINKLKTKVKGIELAKIVYNKLYGNDINFFAIILAKLNITFEIIKTIKSKDETLKFLSSYSSFQNIRIKNTIMNIEENAYDFIIGNPPYFKINNQNFIYKEHYKDIMYGQQNIYSLFIYWSIKSVNSNGKISLIVPQSFRTGLYFLRLRKALSQLHIISIINFMSRTHLFPNVEQAVLIISLQKIKRNEKHQIKLGNVEAVNIQSAAYFKAASSKVIWGDKFDYYLFIPRNRSIYNIIEKIYELSSNLKTLGEFSFGTGGYVWNQHKELLTNNFSGNSAPIIYSSYIEKHDFLTKEIYNSQRTDKKCYSLKDPKVQVSLLQGQRLLVQRTSTYENMQRIKASVISDEFLENYSDYFLENHVNYLYCSKNKNITIDRSLLLFFQALFNSRILNFIFKCKNGNTQVGAKELNLLPISFNRKDDIVDIMENYYRTKNKLLLDDLENLIFENYQVTREEIDLILNVTLQ